MYALIGSFMGINSISFSLIWQMVAISIILTILQYVLYTFNFMSNVKMVVNYRSNMINRRLTWIELKIIRI